MIHTLQDAVAIAMRLEPLIFAKFNLHIAIGGSCVYRGTSEKDVDIFIYPHSKEVEIERDKIVCWLADQGFTYRLKNAESPVDDHTQVPDVWVTTEEATGKKADFFFMERHNCGPHPDAKDDRKGILL
jgi:hypothetical protein